MNHNPLSNNHNDAMETISSQLKSVPTSSLSNGQSSGDSVRHRSKTYEVIPKLEHYKYALCFIYMKFYKVIPISFPTDPCLPVCSILAGPLFDSCMTSMTYAYLNYYLLSFLSRFLSIFIYPIRRVRAGRRGRTRRRRPVLMRPLCSSSRCSSAG